MLASSSRGGSAASTRAAKTLSSAVSLGAASACMIIFRVIDDTRQLHGPRASREPAVRTTPNRLEGASSEALSCSREALRRAPGQALTAPPSSCRGKRPGQVAPTRPRWPCACQAKTRTGQGQARRRRRPAGIDERMRRPSGRAPRRCVLYPLRGSSRARPQSCEASPMIGDGQDLGAGAARPLRAAPAGRV